MRVRFAVLTHEQPDAHEPRMDALITWTPARSGHVIGSVPRIKTERPPDPKRLLVRGIFCSTATQFPTLGTVSHTNTASN
jgi:hypothetical protein